MQSILQVPQTVTGPVRLAFKAFVVAGVTVVILIALYVISGTIDSRQGYRDEATRSIAQSYAASQTIAGPILVRPFTVDTHETHTDAKGVKQIVDGTRDGTVLSFPHELNITGVMMPSERRHGLYKVPVYELQSHLAGSIDVRDAPLRDGETAHDLVYGKPYLALSVSDVRGIVGTPKMKVDDQPVQMIQGVPDAAPWGPNLQVPIHLSLDGPHPPMTFALDLSLDGTEQLNIAPVGDSNHIQLNSAWPSPLFAGSFLPRSRDVTPQGFKATWDISSLASATQTQIAAGAQSLDGLNVDLITPIDPYKLSDRAVKYGILFVIVTFGGFFLFEIMKRLPIHPVQYLLVGLGLAIFFLLLISFSEHMPFAAAYLAASAACIALLTFYLTFVLRSVRYGLTFGALLTALYANIYGLLISEDNALILGSLMLFSLLAVAMYITRNVDWYKGSATAIPAA
jgi:inner membrane protein